MPNEIWKAGLTAEACGVLGYLLSLPFDWVVRKGQLSNVFRDCGRDKMTRIIKELEAAGYILSVEKRGVDGRIDYDHIVYDKPFNGEPFTENPLTAEPLTAEPLLQSTIKQKNNPSYSVPLKGDTIRPQGDREIDSNKSIQPQTSIPQSTNRAQIENLATQVNFPELSTHDQGIDMPRSKKVPQIEDFDLFWSQYPRKVNKKGTMTKWRNLTKANRNKALEALPLYLKHWQGKEIQFIPHATTWLNQERFNEMPESESFTVYRFAQKIAISKTEASNLIVKWNPGQWALINRRGQVMQRDGYHIGTAPTIPHDALECVLKSCQTNELGQFINHDIPEMTMDEVRAILNKFKADNNIQ